MSRVTAQSSFAGRAVIAHCEDDFSVVSACVGSPTLVFGRSACLGRAVHSSCIAEIISDLPTFSVLVELCYKVVDGPCLAVPTWCCMRRSSTYIGEGGETGLCYPIHPLTPTNIHLVPHISRLTPAMVETSQMTLHAIIGDSSSCV